MRRIATAAVLAALATALTGCGHQVYRAQAPDVTTACVDGLPAVSGHALSYLAPKEKPEARRVEFAAVAACVTLDGKPLPIALYRLDGLQDQSEIDVRILLSEGGTFAASAELLDGQFQSVKRYTFSDFVRRTNEYSLSVFVDRSRPVAPVYLLLRPDADHVGRNDTSIMAHSTALALPAGSYRFGSEVTRLRPLVGAGQLQVVPYPARRAGFDRKE